MVVGYILFRTFDEALLEYMMRNFKKKSIFKIDSEIYFSFINAVKH